MTFYWILFVLPIGGMLLQTLNNPAVEKIAWWALSFSWVILIGFRHEVGCDWEPYSSIYDGVVRYVANPDHRGLLIDHEFGYSILNWVSAKLGLGIYTVNTICGSLVVIGLSKFCRRTPQPWLAWLIATPYFLIVVGMGYSRQGVAVGLFLWGLVYLQDRRIWMYLLMGILAFAFHKPVLPFVLIGAVAQLRWTSKVPVWVFASRVIVLSVIVFSVYRFSGFQLETVLQYSQHTSFGGIFRALFSVIPAILFLGIVISRRFEGRHNPIWTWFALISVAGVPLVGLFSTLIDRMLLYTTIPLQLYVWPQISAVGSTVMLKVFWGVLIVVIYAAGLFAWLQFSDHAHCWVPYNNILFR